MAKYVLEGIAVSPGIAIGPLTFSALEKNDEKRIIEPEEVAIELEAISKASERVCSDLETRRNIVVKSGEYLDLLEAQIMLAKDPRIIDGAMARVVMRKICASWALTETIEELISLFRDLQDPSIAERVQDIQAIGECLKNEIQQASINQLAGILIVQELSPALILNKKTKDLKGIVTAEGGGTTHSLIMAKSLNIPVISGVNNLFAHARKGQIIILDGYAGKILLEPEKSEIKKYSSLARQANKVEENIRLHAKENAQTRDGIKIKIQANLESPAQLDNLKNSGAEGIGLYRTEFSFMGNKMPSEEDLVKEYAAIFNANSKFQVIFRTLDIGSDKKIAGLQNAAEENPALGLRGIRFCLNNKELFKMQLRAILKTCKKNRCGILLPMISCIDEFFQTRQLLEQVHKNLVKENIEHAYPPRLGIMLETPAAVLVAERLAKHCDFFSIGTNDLLHYLLAIDRNNRQVNYLHDPLHCAFLLSLQNIVNSSKKHRIPVSVCGELAADPIGVIILLGSGIRNLSTTPIFIPALKYFIRSLDTQECEALVLNAIETGNTKMIRKKLQKLLKRTPVMNAPFPLKISM